MDILLLGLSNKIGLTPFDSSTNSGEVIDKIINKMPEHNFIKQNLVNYAPTDKQGKLRYPNKKELQRGVCELNSQIHKYDIVICFGNIVQKEVAKLNKANVINEYHPSYIYVYKRKQIEEYVNKVCDDINKKICKS